MFPLRGTTMFCDCDVCKWCIVSCYLSSTWYEKQHYSLYLKWTLRDDWSLGHDYASSISELLVLDGLAL